MVTPLKGCLIETRLYILVYIRFFVPFVFSKSSFCFFPNAWQGFPFHSGGSGG